MRVTDELNKSLERLSQATERSKSYIAEKALLEYIQEMSWLLEEAKIGLKDLENGRVVSEKEMHKFFDQLRAKVKKSK